MINRNILGASFAFALTALFSFSLTTQALQQTKSGESAQKNVEKSKSSQDKKSFTLGVSKNSPRVIRLTAKNARLSEISEELSRKMNVPVRLSSLMSKQTVSEMQFEGLNLEATLRMLAPHPYVDYVLGGDANWHPKPLAIYLNGLNETQPSLYETVKNDSQLLMIEGHTEEGTEEYEKARENEEEALRVVYTNNRLSVLARKQPLSVVMYQIAKELGIPFDMKADNSEIVDVNFKSLTIEQAMRTLSPSVRFFYRADLLNFESYPIRLVLGSPDSQPANAAQSN